MGSPYFASIELPVLGGIEFYNVRFETGDLWSNFEVVQPGVEDLFGPNVNGIEFAAFDAAGEGIVLPDGYLFYISFDSTGEFSGTLAVTQPGAVPEPATIWLMLPGLACGVLVAWKTKARAREMMTQKLRYPLKTCAAIHQFDSNQNASLRTT
jgi:hypothetical protein